MHDHRWSLMLYLRSSQNSIIISESISTACTKKIFNCTAFKFRDIHKTPARKDVHHTSHKWEWTVTDARRTQRTPWKLNANLPNHSKILHKNSRRMRERGEKKTNYAPTDYTRYYYRQYIFMHNTARFSNSLLRSQMAPADVCVCVCQIETLPIGRGTLARVAEHPGTGWWWTVAAVVMIIWGGVNAIELRYPLGVDLWKKEMKTE